MIDYLLAGALGAAAFGVAWFGFLAAKKGGAWALAKLKTWWNAAKNDVADVKADLTAVKQRVTALEAAKAAPAPAAAPPAAA
jgi:hypothetical protein